MKLYSCFLCLRLKKNIESATDLAGNREAIEVQIGAEALEGVNALREYCWVGYIGGMQKQEGYGG